MTTALTPILTAFWDHPQSWKLATYEAHDGYRAWRKALGMAPADIITAVKDSSIRGRGGAGFSSDAVESRVEDSESKLVICSDGSYINGKILPLKQIIDEAIRHCPTVENVIVVRRTGNEVSMDPLRDHWYHDLCTMPIAAWCGAG